MYLFKIYGIIYVRHNFTRKVLKVKKNNLTKRLKLFDIAKDGKGLSKNSNDKIGGYKRFFISFKDNFGKIMSVNILMVLGNFPLIFLIATLAGITKVEGTMPAFDVFQNLAGYFANSTPSAHSMTLFAQEGLQSVIPRATTMTYIFYAIAATTLFTFGCVNVGSAYILRNIAKGDPVFVWSDFWYAIKRNWKQALPFGMLDAGINALLIWNIFNMFGSMGAYFTNTMFWCNIVLFILYSVMRFYIYIQMVTFELKVFKILKNSLIFAVLGFKRNAVALLGIIFALLIELICIFGVGGILLPFGIALPFMILLAFLSYMKVYAAYFKIKEVMIDPYLADHPEEAPKSYDDEIIMSDDVTERERLKEIKKRNSMR